MEAVLFDLDGTLIDHDAAAEEAVTTTFLSLPGLLPTDRGQVAHRWQQLETWAMDRYLAGELTFVEQRRLRITTLADELGLGTWSTAQADTWFSRYLKHYESAWQTYPDVAAALTALTVEHGQLRLGVITNGDAQQQRRKLRHVGLASLLKHTTISSEVGSAKPDARIFEAACSQLRLAPARVVYIGDRLETDAEAAIAAGLRGVWLDRQDITTTTDTATSVPRITTLAELPPLLRNMPPPVE